MGSRERPRTTILCSKCGKEMSIRNDYLSRHTGICLSCHKRGNHNNLKHGDYKERLYKIWIGLSHRRYKTHQPMVCEEWKDYSNFKEWSLSHGYNDNLTIDRIDNNGNYEPSNCQWITLQENAGKDKRIFTDEECIRLTEERKNLHITQIEMAKMLGVSRNTIQRLEERSREIG